MNGMEYAYSMGTLKFKGWADLIWSNPNYIPNISSRIIKDDVPNYPLASSKMRFKALEFQSHTVQKSKISSFMLKI